MKDKTVVVLQDMDGLYPAGIERFVFNVYNSTDRNELRFDFVLSKCVDSFYSKQIEAEHVCVYYLNTQRDIVRRIISYFRFYNYIKRKKYSIIHIEGFTFDHAIHCYLAKKVGVKHIIMHSHNDRDALMTIRHKASFWLARKIVLNSATDFWCCSYVAGLWAFGDRCFKERKVRIVVNGINSSPFLFNEKTRNAIRCQLGYEESSLVIGHVGRFHKQKNHVFLINIFEKVIDKYNNARLLLVGDGELKKDIKELVCKRNLQRNVLFYGTTDRVEELYNAMDVFVLPSNDEGLGIVAVEAQLSGLPVICSCAVPEDVIISDRITFLDLNNEVEWVSKILSIREEKRIGIGTLERFNEKNYDIDSATKDVLKLYGEMIEK